MYNELKINISNEKHRAFFMNGFLSTSNTSAANLHKHNFSEIHFVTGGNATFVIEDKQLTLESGSAMIVPQGTFHCCKKKEQDTLHNAFQIDFYTKEVRTAHIGSETIANFFDEIESLRTSEDYTKTAAYIDLLCSYLCEKEKTSASAVSDYGFIIQEFISTNYNKNIRLCDLANELHLSERQTERLVRLHTGNSFKEEVRKIRNKVADALIKNESMSLSEIAEYVGYETYAGFWKTRRVAADNSQGSSMI